MTRFVHLALLTSALLVLSCGTSDDAQQLPACRNPPTTGPGSASCSECIESSCSSNVSPLIQSCQNYVACYMTCDCSDNECLASCSNYIAESPTCKSADIALESCLYSTCGTQCL
jgi:hypothetical protein